MRPGDIRNIVLLWQLNIMLVVTIGQTNYQDALKADHRHCDTYQLCEQQTHRAVPMNWHRSGSSQSLQINQYRLILITG